MAASANADVFDEVAGHWGLVDDPELSCTANPHEIRFSPDRRRAEFSWERPMINYKGEADQVGGYDVLDRGADFVVLALDGEARRTHDDRPVVWILRLVDEGRRYCWGRTDWADGECIDRYVRCPPPAPVS